MHPALGTRLTPFKHVLVAVDGSRASEHARHQAAALVDSSGDLAFMAITDERGVGAAHQSSLRKERARQVTEEARREASETGLTASSSVFFSQHPARAIVVAAADYDLLALGGHRHSRVAGIVLGSTATLALHTCSVPVLIARPQSSDDFPRHVMAALGDAGDAGVAETARRIAAASGSRLLLAHIGGTDPALDHVLELEAQAGARELASDPAVVVVPGDPVESLPVLAAGSGIDLLVLGSRGHSGARALASVSERVAHRARCSVLVMRPGDRPTAETEA